MNKRSYYRVSLCCCGYGAEITEFDQKLDMPR